MTAEAPRKRGPGRRPEGRKIEVRIPDDAVAVVDAWARRAGQKRATVLRRIILAEVARMREDLEDWT